MCGVAHFQSLTNQSSGDRRKFSLTPRHLCSSTTEGDTKVPSIYKTLQIENKKLGRLGGKTSKIRKKKIEYKKWKFWRDDFEDKTFRMVTDFR